MNIKFPTHRACKHLLRRRPKRGQVLAKTHHETKKMKNCQTVLNTNTYGITGILFDPFTITMLRGVSEKWPFFWRDKLNMRQNTKWIPTNYLYFNEAKRCGSLASTDLFFSRILTSPPSLPFSHTTLDLAAPSQRLLTQPQVTYTNQNKFTSKHRGKREVKSGLREGWARKPYLAEIFLKIPQHSATYHFHRSEMDNKLTI